MPRSHQLRRFAQVRDDLGCHMSQEELLAVLVAPDSHVKNTSFSGLELADVAANGTVFEGVVFRGCTFDAVNLSNCTFTDVLFSGCRFIRCDMGKSWLNRCDFCSCSAPGLTFLKGRLRAPRREQYQPLRGQYLLHAAASCGSRPVRPHARHGLSLDSLGHRPLYLRDCGHPRLE